jgi:hypothetical protein
MKRVSQLTCPSAGLLLTGCIGGDFGMPFEKTVDETRPLAANGEFDLENTNGSVRLATWDEPRVRIEAVKHARSERALDELRIEIVGEGDRLSVRTRYPRPRFLGGAGRVGRVSVPRGARVRVGNVNGRVEVDGVEGAVKAATVNGSVDVAHAGGEVEASAVNGSVDVALARVAPGGRSRLSTTNGSVGLTLPRDANAEVEAHTVNGSVSDRPTPTEPPQARWLTRRRPLRARDRQRLRPHRAGPVHEGGRAARRGAGGALDPLEPRA